MNGDFTGEFNSNITFVSAIGKPIFIINKEGCHIPDDVTVDEASQGVIDALDDHIKRIVKDLTIQRDELLEACVSMVVDGWCMCGSEGLSETQNKVLLAIAKAKGE